MSIKQIAVGGRIQSPDVKGASEDAVIGDHCFRFNSNVWCSLQVDVQLIDKESAS